MKRTIILVGVIVIFLSACAKRIDGTSEETMKASIEEIKKSLDDKKRAKFEESVNLILIHGLDFGKLMQEGGADETISDLVSKLDGKTANEVIAEGERIQAEIEKEEKEEARIEIDELYQKMEQADRDKIMLAKFEISNSRFYKRVSGTYYITEEPIIELIVKNGTDRAVSRAYFTGTLASPNRSVPWLKDDFNYTIPGGLEPGEEAKWVLSPNMFSDWGEVDAPKDAVLEVVVNQLDGPSGELMYSVNGFDEDAKERLAELLEAYPEFKH